jgi:hypothetical protein
MNEPKPDKLIQVNLGGIELQLHAPTDFLIRYKHLGAHTLHYYNSDERVVQNIWLTDNAVPYLQSIGIRILDVAPDDMYESEYNQYLDVTANFMDDDWLN